MKKYILSFLIIILSFRLFAFEFSLGGNVGAVVRREASAIKKGLPQFGIVGDFDFEKAGFQLSFAFDVWTQKSTVLGKTKKNTNFSETLLITPYFPFHKEKFTFTIGPSLGFKFAQSNLRIENIKENWFYIVFGSTFETRYAITEHVTAFLSLGFFIDAGNLQTKNEVAGKAKNKRGFEWKAEYIYTIPKIGIAYVF